MFWHLLDPAVFVRFKKWMAKEAPNRPEIKRRRDLRQAEIVRRLLVKECLSRALKGSRGVEPIPMAFAPVKRGHGDDRGE
jgi:hypothetical protein